MVDIALQVPEWREFQHYKNRTPPWIKLHRDKILDNYNWHSLPVASKALAPCLWLLASDTQDGTIRGDSIALAFRLRVTEQELLEAVKPLVSLGFFIDASTVLACRSQVAIPEGEREGDTEENLSKGRIFINSKSKGTAGSYDFS